MKFKKIILLASILLLVITIVTSVTLSNVLVRGPKVASAQYWDDGSSDVFVPVPEITSDPEPQYDGGSSDVFVPVPEINTPSDTTPARTYTPPAPVYQQPQQPQQPVVYQQPQTVYRNTPQTNNVYVVPQQPVNQNVSNDSNSSSNSSSSSSSSSRASVDNNIDIDNTNYQSQSQTVNIPPQQVIVQRVQMPQQVRTVTREVVREVPTNQVRYVYPQVTYTQAAQTQPQVITAQQPVVYEQPKVVTVAGADVKELPKTGLPLAALALGGLLPAGMKLRKFGQAGRSAGNTSANYIWEQRQLEA